MEMPKNLEMELPYDPTILLLGIYPKEMKFVCQTDICTPMFMAALVTITKRGNQHRCIHQQTNGQRKYSICTQWNMILPQNNPVLSFAEAWMELEDIMVSEISCKQKSKYYMMSLIWGN
jgi:hypothetical protein